MVLLVVTVVLFILVVTSDSAKARPYWIFTNFRTKNSIFTYKTSKNYTITTIYTLNRAKTPLDCSRTGTNTAIYKGITNK